MKTESKKELRQIRDRYKNLVEHFANYENASSKIKAVLMYFAYVFLSIIQYTVLPIYLFIIYRSYQETPPSNLSVQEETESVHISSNEEYENQEASLFGEYLIDKDGYIVADLDYDDDYFYDK